MSRTYKAIFALVAIMVVAYGGWRVYQSRRASKAGMLSENIVHSGNDWTAEFTAMIPAPEPDVFQAVRDVEKSRSDQIRSIRVISESGNTKTVELEMNGPNGQVVTTRMVFDYDPPARRITYHTIDNPAMDMKAEFQFDDHGASTLVRYRQTTTMAQQLPVPDSVVRETIRSAFVSQLEGLKRALNIATTEESGESEEEP
jgi:uncharacterized membrane protein